jgi:hypothetical protein
MSHAKQVRLSYTESCPCGRLCVLCVFFLFYECVEGKVYGFGVEGVKITKVAKKADMSEVAKMAEIPERVQGIQMTTRHVIQPVAKMAEVSIKTTRHVMWSLSKVAV